MGELFNAYDTNTTFLYKYAYDYKIPTIYVIVRKVEDKVIFVNSFREITDDIIRGEDLKNIYDKYRRQNNRISLDLIIYLYTHYVYYGNDLDVMFPDNPDEYPSITRDAKVNLLEKIVDLDKSNRIGATRFDDFDRLEALIKSLNRRISMFKAEDIDKLNTIINIQNFLSYTDPYSIEMSDFERTGSILNISPTKDGKTLEPHDAINLFNDSQATIFTPFIQYNDSMGKSYYRILKGNLKYESMNITPTSGGNRDPDTFYITLWLGNNNSMSVLNRVGITDIYDPAILEKANTTSFYRVVYKVNEGILTAVLPNTEKGNQVTDQEELFARLELGLVGLNVRYVNSVKYKGSFNIYDLDIDETSLLHLILDDKFSPFLYTEERIRPFAYKHRLDIHYREIFSRVGEQVKVINYDSGATFPLSVSSVSLTLQFSSSENSVELPKLVGNEVVKFVSPPNFKWVKFTVNGGVSMSDIYSCVLHLRSFIFYYKIYKSQILSNFYYDFPSDVLSALNERFYLKVDQKKEKTSRRVEELKMQIPELFVDSYADSCQQNAQPVIIRPEERKAWEAQTFFYKGEYRNRQTLDYPAENPRWIFGCNTKERPFIGVRASKNLSNSSEFPYVPCCYKKDQMDENINSDYNIYYRGYVKPELLKKSGHIHKTSPFMKPGEIARIPKILNRSLSTYRNLDELQSLMGVTSFTEPWEFVRYGVPKSENSLLHCVLEAISDPNYDGSEAYVIKVRKAIAYETYPELLKQEMYDYELDTIRALLADPNRYLDPDLFYRALEEYFQINIFVFNTYTDEFGTDLSDIVLPRHRNFHIRPERISRPTVLILTHYGADSNIEHPSCELLVDFYSGENVVIKLFDSQMTKNAYKFLINYANNISWLPHVRKFVDIRDVPPELYPHDNVYGKFDYSELLQGDGRLIGQYIDSIGKARSYSFKYKDGIISFVTLPGMPENVPGYKELARPDVSIVLNNLKDNIATGVSVDDKGLYDGIWFQMFEITEGIYVPINPTSTLPPQYSNLPIGSSNPIQTVTTINNTLRYMRLNRTLHIIYDLIEWLFEIERKNKNMEGKEPTADDLKYIFSFDNYTGDSSLYYDFSKLTRYLPEVNTVQEGIQYLSSKVPQFRQGITSYNREFAEKLYKYLEEYQGKTVGETPLIRNYINSYFMSASDFKIPKNNMILLGSDIYEKWQYDRVAISQNIYQIRDKIDMSIASIRHPIIYIDDKQKIWLIQNTFDGNIYSAFAIAYNWAVYKINTGRSTQPLDPHKVPAHFIYKIGVSQQIIPSVDNTGTYNSYVNILQYTESRYGALLPLL